MTTESAIQNLGILTLLVGGLSHMFQSHVWVAAFLRLRELREVGVFVIAELALVLGALIVSFHNVWRGVPMILTLLGWSQVIKGTVYFLYPRAGLMALDRLSPEKPRALVAPGAVLVALALVLATHRLGLL